jgi:excisionase family DNA binding protein
MTQTTSRRPLLTVADIADYMAVEPKTVRGWLARRAMKFIRVNGRTLRVRAEALDEFIAKREAETSQLHRRRANPRAVRAAD